VNSGASPTIVVIGGGAIGCAVAWELAGSGTRVVVVERGTPGRSATHAAGGMLSPLSEARQPGPFLQLSLASLDLYPAFVAQLQAASGIDPIYREEGKLQVAMSERQAEELAAIHSWQRDGGFEVDLLDGDQVRRLEPALSRDVRGGLLVARDHQVDNRRLGRALWAAAAAAGARFALGDPAVAVESIAGRVGGVRLASGHVEPASRVILAAGAWSGQIAGLPRPLPVTPLRGQMVSVDMIPRVLGRVVLSEGCYLIPRGDGRLLVGATMERAGFREGNTPRGVQTLVAAAMQVLPAVGDAPLVELWSGLRPGTPDELPILGPDPDMAGLYYATGHFRNGILLAPITAKVIADVVLGRTPAVPIEAFAATRFTPVPA